MKKRLSDTVVLSVVINSSIDLKARNPKDKIVLQVPWAQAIQCFEKLFLLSKN